MRTIDLIRFLNGAGWKEVRRQGQHRIFSHSNIEKLVAVPDLGEKSLSVGLLNDILKEAGFEKARLRKLDLSLRWMVPIMNFLTDKFRNGANEK